MTQQPLHIDLDLVPGATPVRGRFTSQGHATEFTGWLEFSQLVHELLAAAQPAAPDFEEKR